MKNLLDVNVLIALLDPTHTFHEKAQAWLAELPENSCATCPITENGLMRILASPQYAPESHLSLSVVKDSLDSFVATHARTFWTDNISLRDVSHFDYNKIHFSKQLTDIYLLGLAVMHQGTLVTFDRKISLDTVKAATAKHLIQL